MKASLLYRLLGLALIGVGIYGWIALSNRNEWFAGFLVLGGLLLVAKDRALALGNLVVEMIRAYRAPSENDDA